MLLSCTVHSVDGVSVLALTGEFDLANAAPISAQLRSALADVSERAVLDLTGVTFVDSAGLHVLDEVQALARERDAQLALVCPQARVLRLLQITGLVDRFSVYPSVERAIAALG